MEDVIKPAVSAHAFEGGLVTRLLHNTQQAGIPSGILAGSAHLFLSWRTATGATAQFFLHSPQDIRQFKHLPFRGGQEVVGNTLGAFGADSGKRSQHFLQTLQYRTGGIFTPTIRGPPSLLRPVALASCHSVIPV
jgi:hypothetical protein